MPRIAPPVAPLGFVSSGNSDPPRDRHKRQLPMPPAGPRTAGGEGEEEDIEHVKAS
jgi:hypothetical protein